MDKLPPADNVNLPERGFTFAELVVALGIFAGSILGLIYSYITLTNLAQLSRDKAAALRVASAKLEDIRSESFYDIDGYKNTIFSPETSDFYPDEIRYQNLDYKGVIYVDSLSATLKQVTVTLCWKQGGRTMGEEWVFAGNADPSTHPKVVSPVMLTTLMTER